VKLSIDSTFCSVLASQIMEDFTVMNVPMDTLIIQLVSSVTAIRLALKMVFVTRELGNACAR
jgi:hypothetical protein